MESHISSSRPDVTAMRGYSSQRTDYANAFKDTCTRLETLDMQATSSPERFAHNVEKEHDIFADSLSCLTDRLPDEVLLLVFEQFLVDIILKVPADLRRISFVCRRWNRVVTPVLYRSMKVDQPLLDIIGKESIGASILRLIQTHSHELYMVVYTKYPFYPLDWTFVAEIITGCKNIRKVKYNFWQSLFRSYGGSVGGQPSMFTRASAPESIFPVPLLEVIKGHPSIDISIRSFSIGISNVLPTSNLTYFHGYITDKSRGNLFISQLPLTRIGTLKLWSPSYCLEARMPKGGGLWNWSQLRLLKLEIMNNFDKDDALLLKLQQTHFTTLGRLSYWDLTTAGQLVDHTSLLRSIIKDTKIRSMEIIIGDQSNDLAFEIAKMGPKIRHLKLNHLLAPDLRIVADACPKLKYLQLFKVDFPNEGDEFEFFESYGSFKRLDELCLRGSKKHVESVTKDYVSMQLGRWMEGISKRMSRRYHKLRISRYFADVDLGGLVGEIAIGKEVTRDGTKFDEWQREFVKQGIFADSVLRGYTRPE